MKVKKVDFDVVPQVALWDELNVKASKQQRREKKRIAGGEFKKSSAIVSCLFFFCLNRGRSECSQPILSICSSSLSACILCYERRSV